MDTQQTIPVDKILFSRISAFNLIFLFHLIWECEIQPHNFDNTNESRADIATFNIYDIIYGAYSTKS